MSNELLESTVQKRTADLQSANNRLSIDNRQKDILISTISHDLINSFNIMLNFTKHLSNDKDLPEQYREIMNRLYHTSNNGYAILDSTLNWAKSQILSPSDRPVITRLSLIISDNIRQHKEVSDAKKINFVVTVDDSIPICCNEYQMNIIFRNLLTNAIKFSHEGGTIWIRNQQIDNWGQIAIRDEGIGMSSEQCNHLFDHTAQVKRQGTNNESGAGIGLLIVKELVESNQGIIQCISKVNHGTVFTLNFMLQEYREKDSNH